MLVTSASGTPFIQIAKSMATVPYHPFPFTIIIHAQFRCVSTLPGQVEDKLRFPDASDAPITLFRIKVTADRKAALNDTHPSITDEERAAVRQVLFGYLCAADPTLAEDTEIFRYNFISPTGNTAIEFELNAGFLDWAIRTSAHVLDSIFESAAEQLVRAGKMESKPKITSTTKASEISGFFAYITMQGIIEKWKSAFRELGLESQKILEGVGLAAMAKTDFDIKWGYKLPSIRDGVTALAKDLAKNRKDYLIDTISHVTGKPQLDRLPQLYPEILKLWQSVRKIYRANSESETWRAMVKAKYPDLEFPDDLLTRITSKPELLSEEIQAKLAETDGDHTPSSIALEHAARIVGASPYQFGVRYLHQRKSNQQTEHTGEK